MKLSLVLVLLLVIANTAIPIRNVSSLFLKKKFEVEPGNRPCTKLKSRKTTHRS